MLKCVPLAFMHCATATEESPRDVTAHVLGRGAERGQRPRLSFYLSPSWSPFYFDDITGASFLAKRSSTLPLSYGPPDRPAFWRTGCWVIDPRITAVSDCYLGGNIRSPVHSGFHVTANTTRGGLLLRMLE